MIERYSKWVPLVLDTPEPLNVSANTKHHVSVAIENESLNNIMTSNNHLGTNPAESHSTKRSALTTHNGYCKSLKRAGGVSLISPIRHAVKVHLVPWLSCLETWITLPVLNCVCVVGANAGASALPCSCFRTDRVCGDGGATLSPVCHMNAPFNVFNVRHGDRYFEVFASLQKPQFPSPIFSCVALSKCLFFSMSLYQKSFWGPGHDPSLKTAPIC